MPKAMICKYEGEKPAYGEFVDLVSKGVVVKCNTTPRPSGIRWPSISFRRLGLNEIVVMFPGIDRNEMDDGW